MISLAKGDWHRNWYANGAKILEEGSSWSPTKGPGIDCQIDRARIGSPGNQPCREAGSGGERGPIRLSPDLQQAIEGACRKHKLLEMADIPSSRF